MTETLEECLLCLRIPLERVLEVTHTLFNDDEVAHSVGVKSAELLRNIYLKNPTTLCGSSPRGLMAGAIYLTATMNGHRINQRLVGAACNCTEVSVRKRFQHLLSLIPLSKHEFMLKRQKLMKQHLSGKHYTSFYFDIDEFKRLWLMGCSNRQISNATGMSISYPPQLARKLGLPPR